MKHKDQPWQIDGRWRRVRVAARLLSQFLQGNGRIAESSAPPDVLVIGLDRVENGPDGVYTFIVWSETFEPVPLIDRRNEVPMIDIMFTAHD